jgi:hypothetical protein
LEHSFKAHARCGAWLFHWQEGELLPDDYLLGALCAVFEVLFDAVMLFGAQVPLQVVRQQF